jgi:ATP adenylyltransferase
VLKYFRIKKEDLMTVDPANAGVVPRGDYGNILQQIVDEGHCPFCREHLQKHHTKPILFENEHWLVTENFKPYTGLRHHFLLIVQRHIERIEDLSTAEEHDFFERYRALAQTYGFAGASIQWRSGLTALTGASVKHLHAHILVGQPRTERSIPITGLVGFYEPTADT